MSNGCPNCEALCAICQDNTYNWHEPLCNSCRLAVAHTEERIIKLLEHEIEGFESEINQLDDGDSLSKGFFLEDIRQHKYLIALIKGENKATSWTSRPITEEDIESYGIEGENK